MYLEHTMNERELEGGVALNSELTATKLEQGSKEREVWLKEYDEDNPPRLRPFVSNLPMNSITLKKEDWIPFAERINVRAHIALVTRPASKEWKRRNWWRMLLPCVRWAPTWKPWKILNWLLSGEHFVPVRKMLAHAALGAAGTVLTGELYAVHIKADGTRVDYGLVGRHLVVTAGKNYVALTFDNTAEPETLKYHGVGTGVTAAAAGDQTLQTECTTATNPDTTRATGSQAHSTNTYTTVGTPTFDASAAITEWGLFNNATAAGAFNATTNCPLDRQVFSAINVASGDSIQFTYVLTVS